MCLRAALVGMDPSSDGPAHARRLGITAIAYGVDGLLAHPDPHKINIRAEFRESPPNYLTATAKRTRSGGNGLGDARSRGRPGPRSESVSPGAVSGLRRPSKVTSFA
jgi:hypothetical protein